MTTVPANISKMTMLLKKRFGILNHHLHERVKNQFKSILPNHMHHQFDLIYTQSKTILIIHPAHLTWCRLHKHQLQSLVGRDNKLAIIPEVPYESLMRKEPEIKNVQLSQQARNCVEQAANTCTNPKLKAALSKMAKQQQSQD